MDETHPWMRRYSSINGFTRLQVTLSNHQNLERETAETLCTCLYLRTRGQLQLCFVGLCPIYVTLEGPGILNSVRKQGP